MNNTASVVRVSSGRGSFIQLSGKQLGKFATQHSCGKSNPPDNIAGVDRLATGKLPQRFSHNFTDAPASSGTNSTSKKEPGLPIRMLIGTLAAMLPMPIKMDQNPAGLSLAAALAFGEMAE
jgi:hypothetical protein